MAADLLPGAIPDYTVQVPTIFPTHLQYSSLPEGFIFIVVGSAILFVALSIVAWHVIRAYIMRRNWKAYQQNRREKLNLVSHQNQQRHAQNIPVGKQGVSSHSSTRLVDSPVVAAKGGGSMGGNTTAAGSGGGGGRKPVNESLFFSPTSHFSTANASNHALQAALPLPQHRSSVGSFQSLNRLSTGAPGNITSAGQSPQRFRSSTPQGSPSSQHAIHSTKHTGI